MKKLFWGIALIAMSVLCAKAETLVNESFNYPEGVLYGNGKWIKYGTKTSYPINIVNGGLQFIGYQEKTAGNAVPLVNQSGESVQILFRDKDTEPVNTAVYYSALINLSVQPSGSKTTAFICLTGTSSEDPTKFGDGISGSEGAGLFAQAFGEGFKLGISRNVLNMGNSKTSISWSTDEYELNKTYLVIVKYEIIEGADNDRISLWVNPANTDEEPVATVAATEDEITESLVNVRGIELRQGSSPVAKIPNVTIDELRVTTTWAEVFNPKETEISNGPEITLSDMSLSFNKSYQGLTYKKIINVKGKNLKEDIRLSGMSSGEIATAESIIPREVAESDTGYQLEIVLTVNQISKDNDKIIFETADAQSRMLTLDWNPIETVTVSSFKELYDEDTKDMTTVYLYTGNATVTCIDTYFYTFYAQDQTAAVEIRSAGGCDYEEIDISDLQQGDNLTNIVGSIIFSDDGGIDFVPVEKDAWTVISKGNAIIPKIVTFEQIRAYEACDIMFQLVTVKDITFDEKYISYPDPEYYGKFNVPYHEISDLTEKGMLWYFMGTDIYNSSTSGYFDKRWTVTGICYYMHPRVAIAPRALSDFEEQEGNAINKMKCDETVIIAMYDLYGRRVTRPGQGIYVARMSDGSVRKVGINIH